MNNKNIGLLLLMIFFAGIFPQQYFIFLHDHEHAISNITQEEVGFHEKLHDCSDQLNYLSLQTDLFQPAEINSFRSKSIHLGYLQQKVVFKSVFSKTVRAPPLGSQLSI